MSTLLSKKEISDYWETVKKYKRYYEQLTEQEKQKLIADFG